MGLFDSLRSKLKGVSKKLEDEVEKQLGDQLEQELQAEMAKGKASPVSTVAPAMTPLAPTPPPAPVPGAQQPAPATLPLAPPPKPMAPSMPAPTSSPAPSAPTPVEIPRPEPAPEPASKPDQSQIARIPQMPPRVESEETGESATPSMATPVAPMPPAPMRPVPVQPAPLPPAAKPAKPAQPPQPQPGRKMHSEAEIEARLERELSEAVAVQKDVEKAVEVARPSAAASTKFTINDQVLDEILWDLEIGLLESDVALPVIEAIKANVKEQLLSLNVGGKKPEEVVELVLRTAIKRVLQVNPMDFDKFLRERLATGKRPIVVMFVGVNGTGKTTSIGRIAYRLKQMGITCCMAAGDTFRAGAIEQLSLHGERLGVTVVKHKAGADPAAVAYDAIEHAKARHKDVVLLDTAGRMQNNRSLMDEMDKVRRVANPDLVVFVGDSLAGNDAVEQARKFDEVVDIGGVILTKVDVDAKGGAALSVAYTINQPLIFVGVGQDYPDLKPFDAGWMVDRLFGDEAEATATAP
ncbi:MAG TPA: signal recognition particle-docking protein FtsY [Candidatus Thermoplasmatota archaeon]|nr:signal recognition particle-docking protein FtsY [Candidatus Thermoplasmatota archaeon]